jgi:hypothetical protein
MPVAVTANVVFAPAHIVELTGWLVIAGDVLIVNVTAFDVTAGVQVPLTTTS